MSKIVHSNISLVDWFRSLPRDMRDSILAVAETDSNFISKKIFTYNYGDGNANFRIKTAIGLDKASTGMVDFRDLVHDGDQIDWEYVRKVLNQRTKKQQKMNKPEVPSEV